MQRDTIDQFYVEGVTLTHGPVGRREHFWTFATGIAETHDEYACPCALSGLGRYHANPPSFVGDDYTSVKQVQLLSYMGRIFYIYNDSLWDRDGYSAENSRTCFSTILHPTDH